MTIPSMESPAWMFSKALSHRQKVMRLYKRCCREVQSWYGGHDRWSFLEYRYQLVLMRQRFDANRDVQDMRMAQCLLADGCRQLWLNRHKKTVRFGNDPGGNNYDREHPISDLVCDSEHYTWAEREQFPYYFNRREQRKRDLMEHWHKIEDAWDTDLDNIQRDVPSEKGEEGSATVGQQKRDYPIKVPPPTLY